MILTVTANPAYDVTYEVEQLDLGAVNRVAAVTERPGGKGVNVARVLAQLDKPACVMGFGNAEFSAAVQGPGLTVDLVHALPRIRRTVVVSETVAGITTSLWEPGATVNDPDAVAELLARVRTRLTDATGVVISGSLPGGTEPGLPAAIAQLATAAGLPVICDIDGAALELASRSVPGVVLVPNNEELQRLTGSTASDVVAACRGLLAQGVGAVVATRGADGMIAVTAEGAWHAGVREPLQGNPTGAGDAAAAAIISHLADAGPVDWSALLTDAVATSAAAVARPIAGEIDVAVRDRLFATVRIEKLYG